MLPVIACNFLLKFLSHHKNVDMSAEEENRILSDFTLIDSKYADKIADLPLQYQEYLVNFLEREGELGTYFQDNGEEHDDNGAIFFNLWKWRGILLIDIFAYPGGNQSGIIVLPEGETIFIIYDGTLEVYRDGYQTDERLIPLIEDRKLFEHLRDSTITPECQHESCWVTSRRFKKLYRDCLL